jgi:hypothetical protein
MYRLSFIAFLGVLSVWMGACSSDSGSDTTSSTPPSPVPAASKAPVAAQPNNKNPKAAQSFAPPVIAQKPGGSTAAANLIQPTNADERVQQIQKGRQDPFAVFPIRPVIERSPTPATGASTSPGPVPQAPATLPTRPSGSRPSAPRTGATRTRAIGANAPRAISRPPRRSPSAPVTRPGTSATASRPNAPRAISNNAAPPRRSGAPAARPGVQSEPRIAALPPLPEPNLARAVEITGVIKVGDTAQAIVRAPNEGTSRYVSAGQRLSDGQVLVKRIDMNEGSDPVVVLEQYGVEISKTVGEGSTTPTTGTTS